MFAVFHNVAWPLVAETACSPPYLVLSLMLCETVRVCILRKLHLQVNVNDLAMHVNM